jgi:hypothetical protein
MNIALLGDPEDLAIAYIAWLAGRRNFDVLVLPESTLGIDWSFALAGAPGQGWLRSGVRRLDLCDLSGVFVRLNPQPLLPAGLSLDEVPHGVFTQERREGLHHFLEMVGCPVVNRPSGGRANASKPLQMTQLREAGFKVPRWVVSNLLDVVSTFALGCPSGAIYKATSGLRSRVRVVDDSLRERLRFGTTPTVVQEFIPGRDIRVHTVGDQAFATEMVAQAIDYRFEANTQYLATTIDSGLAAQCCDYARAEGLLLAGFDFRVTEDGEWYCLEMNPVPSFLPYEMCSGQPIGGAVLDFLSSKQAERDYRREPDAKPQHALQRQCAGAAGHS